MKLGNLFLGTILAATATARSAQHVGKKLPQLEQKQTHPALQRRGDFPRRANSKYDTPATQRKSNEYLSSMYIKHLQNTLSTVRTCLMLTSILASPTLVS